MRPLDGIVVLDFTRVLAGPYATMLLADLGADVIKVERPGTGDDTRGWGPPFRGEDATYFLSVNRGKRSVVLDLADDADRTQAVRLAATADVLVENFRPGVMARFGLDHASLAPANPRLVCCSIPAYAASAGASDKPGYDLLMQASAGLMSITGHDAPAKVGVAVLDLITGLWASNGILAALAARERTGEGQQVTVGLYDASLATLANQSAAYLMAGLVPGLTGNAHNSIVPYQSFSGSDADFVLAAGNDKLFRATAELAGLAHLADDARFATNSGRVLHRAELIGVLQERFRQQSAQHWVARCEARGVPAALIRSLDQVFAAPEAAHSTVEIPDAHRGPLTYVRPPLQMSGTPLEVDGCRPPPLLGEHDDEVLGPRG